MTAQLSASKTLHAELAHTAEPAAVRLLRTQCAQKLTEWGVTDEVAANVLVVASELLTNALIHAHAATLTLELDLVDESGSTSLRVGASDPVPGLQPRRRTPVDGAPVAENGNGLALVEELTDHWGVTREKNLKTVYGVFHLRPAP